MTTKTAICAALRRWIKQRPGLEFGNYGDVSAYRSEMRSITTDRHHAEALLAYVERSDSITAESLIRAAQSAYSGRMTFDTDEINADRVRIDYTTGQYWPTEYRRAACAVLASAIWEFWREECMPEGELVHNSETGETFKRYNGLRAGDYLRRMGRREFGAAIARRWFD